MGSMMFRRYLYALRRHPGTPIAVWMMVLGGIAGAEGGWDGAAVGVLVMSVSWVPVLITAWQSK